MTVASSPGRRPASVRPYLNVGCGSRLHPDWTNLDLCPRHEGVLPWDAHNPLPFESESFEAVYHSHLLEHLRPSQAAGLLAECFRVLVPGGIARVAVPDLEAISRLYLEKLSLALGGDESAGADRDWLCLEMFDQMVREKSGGEMKAYLAAPDIRNMDFVVARIGEEAHDSIASARREALERAASRQPRPEETDEKEKELDRLATERFGPGWREALMIGLFRQCGEAHRAMHDRYSLGRALAAAGFAGMHVCRAGDSRICDFSSFHLEVTPDGMVRKPDSLFMEAVKPSL